MYLLEKFYSTRIHATLPDVFYADIYHAFYNQGGHGTKHEKYLNSVWPYDSFHSTLLTKFDWKFISSLRYFK